MAKSQNFAQKSKSFLGGDAASVFSFETSISDSLPRGNFNVHLLQICEAR